MKTGVVIDNGNYVDKLKGQFGQEKVYGVQVNSARSNNDMYAHFNETNYSVKIDKLMQNTQCLSEIKAGRIGTFANPKDPNLNLFIQHWKNVLFVDEEEADHSIVRLIKRKGADHFAQACVYAYVGMKKLLDDRRNAHAAMQVSNLNLSGSDTDVDLSYFE